MKKSFLTASIALGLSAMSVSAQEQAGGSSAEMFSIGGVKGEKVIASGVALGVVAAMLSNTSGATVPATPTPTPTPNPTPACNGEDPLVDGFCVGTDVTVTVSGTTTISVPVTFTYAPTV